MSDEKPRKIVLPRSITENLVALDGDGNPVSLREAVARQDVTWLPDLDDEGAKKLVIERLKREPPDREIWVLPG